jgi:hypothetical protein
VARLSELRVRGAPLLSDLLGAQLLPGCLVVTVRLAARAGIHSSPDELFAVAAEPAPRYWFAV